MMATIYGAKALFCDAGCRDSFREDRRRGLIYGSVLTEDGRIIGWEAGSIYSGTCAYCNAPVQES